MIQKFLTYQLRSMTMNFGTASGQGKLLSESFKRTLKFKDKANKLFPWQ